MTGSGHPPYIEWTFMPTHKQRVADACEYLRSLPKNARAQRFDTLNSQTATRAELAAILEWQDPDGDYEGLDKPTLALLLARARGETASEDEDSRAHDLLYGLLQDFCRTERLPLNTSIELLKSDLTDRQRAWLIAFQRLWTATQELRLTLPCECAEGEACSQCDPGG